MQIQVQQGWNIHQLQKNGLGKSFGSKYPSRKLIMFFFGKGKASSTKHLGKGDMLVSRKVNPGWGGSSSLPNPLRPLSHGFGHGLGRGSSRKLRGVRACEVGGCDAESSGVSFGATSRLLPKAVLGCPFFFQFHFCSNGIINPIKWHDKRVTGAFSPQ